MTQQELFKRIESATIIRSKRRTLSMEIRKDLSLLIRAPLRVPEREIRRFVRNNLDWIVRKMTAMEQKKKTSEEAKAQPFTEEEIRELAEQARRELPPRLADFAEKMGVTYQRITIRNQRTRWGSCSSKGGINLNCLLMLCPREVQDYVLVHELAHRKEMNHSKRFWEHVEAMLPDYREHRRWLREHGEALIGRLNGRA